jgi:hypothetical protein
VDTDERLRQALAVVEQARATVEVLERMRSHTSGDDWSWSALGDLRSALEDFDAGHAGRWTMEPPKEEGVYFMDSGEVALVRPHGSVSYFGSEDCDVLGSGLKRWSVPIPMPQAPK